MNGPTNLTKGERTRAHIVTTAAGLFWRRNFHGVSVDQIAEAAKVNKATIYRYFADKNDIALAVTRYNGEISLEIIFAGAFSEFSAPNARLAAIYRQVYCAQADTQNEDGDVYGCPIVGLALELGQELPALREEAGRIFNQVEQMMTQIARDAYALKEIAADPAPLGRTLTQLLHGAFASARLASDPQLIVDAGSASLALIGFPNTPILETE
ncbi:MAG: TetR/AcrR family transcriptional regulator [Pseudomonadota bacterium]